eukprot:TRINITY_DN33806_c0_g1_i3.p1 TRINITY_DN33806_c0_g1~~TRINITY_DN33806_c0_g1_i3.p1  ORF type:complete len:557 (+),score=142.42 TRINITY_DN33806_c0_g1_i3:56-1672(+)
MAEPRAKSGSAEFKVGATSYIRYIHAGDSYVCVAGHTVKDKDFTWKVKIDKKTGKRFYVSLGSHGRAWTLPDIKGDDSVVQQEPSQSVTPPAARRTPSKQIAMSPPAEPRRAHTAQPERDINESITLLEVYKQRLPFNPDETCPAVELPPDVLHDVTEELARLSAELQLSPEAVLSAMLSVQHYLQAHPSADPVATTQKLCYAVASDSTADALSSPFLEVQSKIDFLVSINDSVNKTLTEQSFDLSVIRTNIDLREQERKRANTKLGEWRSKCNEADTEVDHATDESVHVARLVETHLERLRTVLQCMHGAFPADSRACLAHVEKLKAELQESCNSSRSLLDSYKRVKLLRSSLHDTLATLSRDTDADKSDQQDVLQGLRHELARSKDENAKLLLRLSKLSVEAESPTRHPQEVRALQAQLRQAKEAIASLKSENERLVAAASSSRSPQAKQIEATDALVCSRPRLCAAWHTTPIQRSIRWCSICHKFTLLLIIMIIRVPWGISIAEQNTPTKGTEEEAPEASPFPTESTNYSVFQAP